VRRVHGLFLGPSSASQPSGSVFEKVAGLDAESFGKYEDRRKAGLYLVILDHSASFYRVA
jgi:hypothetical protein